MADHLVAGLHCADVEDLAASFVLGALEAAEAHAVRRHVAGCPEAHPEFAELGSVVPTLFETVEIVAPPATLRERILAAAAAEPQVAERAQAPTAPTAPPAPRAIDTQRSGGWAPGRFRRPVWAAVGIAAALALVALGAWNIQLRDEIAGLTAYRNGVVEVLDQAAAPGSQLAVLASEAGAAGPTGLAAVATDGSVALVMRDLKPTSGVQVYEAWLIGADGAPVPIGGFHVDRSGTASFVTTNPAVGSGVTVALTLEPGPGAKTPTAPIIAAGKASAQSS